MSTTYGTPPLNPSARGGEPRDRLRQRHVDRYLGINGDVMVISPIGAKC
jgi:hypothetical protein